MVDSIAASYWNFRGRATDGTPIDVAKDYWFDWREYNPETTVFGIPARR